MAYQDWYYEPEKDRPCPWCGGYDPDPDISNDELVVEVYEDMKGRERYYIRCQNCDGSGPVAPTPREAWERWNTRPAPAWEKWNTRPLPWPED